MDIVREAIPFGSSFPAAGHFNADLSSSPQTIVDVTPDVVHASVRLYHFILSPCRRSKKFYHEHTELQDRPSSVQNPLHENTSLQPLPHPTASILSQNTDTSSPTMATETETKAQVSSSMTVWTLLTSPEQIIRPAKASVSLIRRSTCP